MQHNYGEYCTITRVSSDIPHHLDPAARPLASVATMPVAFWTSILDFLVPMCSLAAFLAIRDYHRRQGLPYPPGPRPLPLIGNVLDIPKEFSWLSYTQLSKKYGMVYFAVRGRLTEGWQVISYLSAPLVKLSWC